VGPRLVESMRTYLQANPERRGVERLVYANPLLVHPVLTQETLAEAIACWSKDISLTGIGFYFPQLPISKEVLVDLSQALPNEEAILPAKIVRVQPFGDQGFEIGAQFPLEALPYRGKR